MREIKFRAWDWTKKKVRNNGKGWYKQDGYIMQKAPYHLFSELKFRLYNTDTKTTYIYTLATLIGKTFRRGKFEFRGRWTGLKDKTIRGKEIYEGDIATIDDRIEGIQNDIKVIVRWNNMDSKYELYSPEAEKVVNFTIMDILEVIGNIYQNKEFLNDHK